MSKIGIHSIIGPRTGFGEFCRSIAQAGQRLAVVKGVDDFGACGTAKSYDSRTLTIGRLNSIDNIDLQGLDDAAQRNQDPLDTARWYYGHVRPRWELNRSRVDVWECFNEWSGYWEYQSDVLIHLMGLAELDGFRLGLFGTSTGNPPDSSYPAIARACQRAKGHGHVMCVHEYGGVGTGMPGTLKGTQPFHALRYRRLYDYLRSVNAVVPLVISEAGQEGGGEFIGTQPFIDDLAWYDAELMQDDYVIGACAWTLGRWAGANFQEALPALADYIIAHPNQEQPGPLPYRAYLPVVVRGAPPAESVSPGAFLAALALGAGVWLIGRRMRARRHA